MLDVYVMIKNGLNDTHALEVIVSCVRLFGHSSSVDRLGGMFLMCGKV
jgi:hypothetical protein